ncbi:MAG: hypothetical protein Q7J86_09075 [Bacteroidota bacterium]|nr:hypothetical protein [Bacteroidota bacterium]
MDYDNNVFHHSTLDDGCDYFTTDKWRKKYHFRISSFPVPSGLLSEALEIVDENGKREPYSFTILSDYDEDEEYAELMLKAKIKKGINQRHLKNENGKLVIGNDQTLRGRIESTNGFSETQFDYYFVIDGKRITIEEFVDLMKSFEGWNFKFQIIDSVDDLD